jgi:ABC-type amino acid transport substrate-binding protein
MVCRMMRRLQAFGATAVAAVVLTGCGMTVPADPDGTLERVEGGVMRVGATENAPWVEVADNGDPSGTEPTLVLEFAEQLDAEVEWTVGSEATLAEMLEAGELDLVIGGFHEDTPWTEFAAATRPYVEAGHPDGTTKQVMLAPLGENAFLVALERFLDEEAVS